jgi:hypothetical protein
MEALRKFGIPPGDYAIPYAGGAQGVKSPAYLEKRQRGPVLFATVVKTGTFSMNAQLVQWFVFCLVASVVSAYITSRAVVPGDSSMAVFRFAGTSALIFYAAAQWADTIWYKRSWTTVLKNTFDGLIYAVLTAGAFMWLWPE